VFNKDVWPSFVSILWKPHPHSCVIQCDDRVVGFALLSYGAERTNLPQGLEIAFLAIDEEYQGNGLGGELLEYIKTLNYQHTLIQMRNVFISATDSRFGERLVIRRKEGMSWDIHAMFGQGGYARAAGLKIEYHIKTLHSKQK
jgi:GNAT superfamily N-acetyltransferase